MTDLRSRLIADPGTRIRLAKLDPGATHGFDKERAASVAGLKPAYPRPPDLPPDLVIE